MIQELLPDFLGAYGVDPSSTRGQTICAAYAKAFNFEHRSVLEETLRRIQHEIPHRLPNVPQFAAVLAHVKAERRQHERRQERTEERGPLSAVEYREWALAFAAEAADHVRNCGGGCVEQRWLEDLAEWYAAEAQRVEQGEQRRPVPDVFRRRVL